jgi:hypothetical protein
VAAETSVLRAGDDGAVFVAVTSGGNADVDAVNGGGATGDATPALGPDVLKAHMGATESAS